MPEESERERDVLSPEARKRFEEALARRRKVTQPLVDEVERSTRITGDDLKIRVNY